MLITEGGPDVPEVRQNNGTIRRLTSASLNQPLYPWMDVAPDGRAFYSGPDNRMGSLNPSGTGAWQMHGARDGVDRDYGSHAMYDIGKILVAGGGNSLSERQDDQPERGEPAGVDDGLDGDGSTPAQPHGAGRRDRPRHRRELLRRGPRRHQQRRLHRRALEPRHRNVAHARLDAGDSPVPLDRAPAAGRAGALLGRRHLRSLRLSGLSGEERRGVLSALSVQEGRVGRPCAAADDHFRARDGVLQRAVHDQHAGSGLDRQGRDGPAGGRDALGEHGAALRAPVVHGRRRQHHRDRSAEREHRPAGVLHAVRDRHRRRPVRGEHGAGRERHLPPRGPEPHRHRPRLPGQRQQPRGQGLGRGRLDGPDLLDRRLHGLAACERHRRHLQRGRDHHPGPRRPDHQPPRHRDRRRRQRLGLLERPRLHRGLDRPRDPERSPTPTPTPRPTTTTPRSRARPRPARRSSIYSTAGCTGSPLASGTAATFNGAGITTPVAGDQTTNLRATATDAAGNASGCSSRPRLHRGLDRPQHPGRLRPPGPDQRHQPRPSASRPTGGAQSYECRFDSASFGPCSGPGDSHTASPQLSDGRPHLRGPRHRLGPEHRPTPGQPLASRSTPPPGAPRASPTPTPTPRPTTTTPRSRARPKPARRSASTRPPTARARRSRAAPPPPSTAPGSRPRSRRPDHQPPRHRDRRRRQRLGLLERPRLHRGLLRPRDPERHRHRPRLPGQRQQPRGQGLGRGRLDGADLLDRRLHRLAACERLRRHLQRGRDHDPGRRRSDHQPPRHRHRLGRQRLGLLERPRLHRGLDRPQHPGRLRPPGPDQRPDPDLRLLGHRRRPELRMPLRLGLVRSLLGPRRHPHRLAPALRRTPHLRGPRHRLGPEHRPDPGQPLVHRRHPGPQHPGRLRAQRPDQRPDPDLRLLGHRRRPELRMPLRLGLVRSLLGPRRHPHRLASSPTAPTPSRSAPPTRQATPTARRQPDPSRSTPPPPRPRSTPAPRARPQTTTPASPSSSSESNSSFECRLDGPGASHRKLRILHLSQSLHRPRRRHLHLPGPRHRLGPEHRPDPGQPLVHRRHPGSPHPGRLRPPGPDQRLDPDLRLLGHRRRPELRMPLRLGLVRSLLGPRRHPHRLARSQTDPTPSRSAPPTRPRTPTRPRPAARFTVDTQRPQHPGRLRAPTARPTTRPRPSASRQPAAPRATNAASTRPRSVPARAPATPTPPRPSSPTDPTPSRSAPPTRPGNTDDSAATRSFTVDTSAPQTQVDSGPQGPTSNNDPSFGFASSESNSSFECRLDGPGASTGTFASCTSPRAFTDLADGTYTFQVRATDSAQNTDQTPASRSFTVDTQAPSLSITSGPNGQTNNPSPTFAFNAEAGSTLECSIDQGTASFGPCSSASSHSPGPPLAEGSHTFRVRATDNAGNAVNQTRSFSVDTAAPNTSLTSGPQGPTSNNDPSFAFSSSEPNSSFECRLDGPGSQTGSFASCASSKSFTDLADGTYTFQVRATDSAQNTDQTPASRSFTVDTSAPQTQVDSGPQGPTSNNDPSFGFSSSESNSSFECRLDGPGAARPEASPSCTSPRAFTDLADGTYTFEVRATDSAQNTDQSPASRSFTVDTSAPAAPSLTDTDPDSPANDNNPEVKGSAEAGSTVKIYSSSDCSGSPLASGTAEELDSPGLTVNVAADQTTSLRARASDRAGNESGCSAAIEYTEDSTPPDTELTDAPLPESTKRKVKFAFSSTEAQSTFRCSLDKATMKHCKPPLTKRVARGTHVFRVYALDRSGNADSTPAKVKFKVIANR